MRSFKIVRDLSKYSYKKGSDRIVITQYDTGIHLNFEFLNRSNPLNLFGYRGFISFVNQEGKILLTEECTSIQDLTLESTTKFFYVMDEALTKNSGELTAIIDLIDTEGNRTAINPFVITILPHLLKDSITHI